MNRECSYQADVLTDLSHFWHNNKFVGFVTLRLKCNLMRNVFVVFCLSFQLELYHEHSIITVVFYHEPLSETQSPGIYKLIFDCRVFAM